MDWKIRENVIFFFFFWGVLEMGTVWVQVYRETLSSRTPTQFWRGRLETEAICFIFWGSGRLRIEDTWPHTTTLLLLRAPHLVPVLASLFCNSSLATLCYCLGYVGPGVLKFWKWCTPGYTAQMLSSDTLFLLPVYLQGLAFPILVSMIC